MPYARRPGPPAVEVDLCLRPLSVRFYTLATWRNNTYLSTFQDYKLRKQVIGDQGREFCVKGDDTKSEGKRSSSWLARREGRRMGTNVSSPYDSGVRESILSCPSGIGDVFLSCENLFCCNLISAYRLSANTLTFTFIASYGNLPYA